MSFVKKVTRSGWTCGEVAAVLAILGLLLLLVAPYLLSRRSDSRRLLCERRLARLSEALIRYEGDQSRYPGYRGALARRADGTTRPIGWVFAILPQLEPLTPDSTGLTPGTIAERYGPGGPAETRGTPPTDQYLADLVCPTDERFTAETRRALSSFVVNAGQPDAAPTADAPADWPANGVCFDALAQAPASLSFPGSGFVEAHDGLNQTLLLSENTDAGLWTDHQEPAVSFVWVEHFENGQPNPGTRLLRINQRRSPPQTGYPVARPSSWHRGGVNVVFCNGRTQFLSEKIDYLVYANLMTSAAHDVRRPGTTEWVEPPYRVE